MNCCFLRSLSLSALFTFHFLSVLASDSLVNIIKHRTDTNAVLAFHELGKEVYLSGNLDSAYHFFLDGNKLANKLDYTRGKILILRGLGSLEAKRGNFDESKKWLDQGFELIEKENLAPINRVDYLINLGVAYYFKGEIANALEPYIEAIEICREHGYDDKRAMLLNNTGIFYRTLERYEDALDIYKESYELRIKLKDTMGMANNLLNMTASYSYLGDYENAFRTSKQAKDLYIKINSKNDIILSTLSVGTALINLEKYEEAFVTMEPLNNYNELPFDPEHRYLFHISMAKLYLKKNQNRKAQKHLNTIEDELEASDMVNFKIDFYRLKSDYFQNENDFKSANIYLNKLIDASKEKKDIQNSALLKEMETKFFSKEKDYKIAMLNSENEINALKLNASNQRNIILSIGSALLILLLGGLYFLYRKIKVTNQSLSEANEDKEILLKEIHHRVKNNLQVISALLSLQSNYVKDESAIDAIRKGHDRVESMALIHKDLYQHDNLKGVNTKDYLEKLIENLFSSYKINESKIELQLDIESIWLDVDTMVPLGLMINEMVSNSLKHAFNNTPKGILKITLQEVGETLELIVKDNGEGLKVNTSEENKSFGQSLIKSFARKLDAEMRQVSKGGLEIFLKIKEYKKIA